MAKCMQKAQIANVLLWSFHRQHQIVGYSCCSFGIREHITTAPINPCFWLICPSIHWSIMNTVIIDPLIDESSISNPYFYLLLSRIVCLEQVASPSMVREIKQHSPPILPACLNTPDSALEPLVHPKSFTFLLISFRCFCVNTSLVGKFHGYLVVYTSCTLISAFLRFISFSVMNYDFEEFFGYPGLQSYQDSGKIIFVSVMWLLYTSCSFVF